MAKWEYKQVRVGGLVTGDLGKGSLQSMNELGAQGWELVTIYADFRNDYKGGQAIFKRQVSAEDWGASPVDPKRPRKPTGRAPSRFD